MGKKISFKKSVESERSKIDFSKPTTHGGAGKKEEKRREKRTK